MNHPGAGNPDAFTVPDADQHQAWQAVRARLAMESPWLTAALFRAVPVAVDAHVTPLANADRWGRVYLNFDAEPTAGIAKLAAAAQAAVLDWISGQAADQQWHLPLTDPRFPAVGAAEATGAAHAAAAGLAASSKPDYGSDPLADWRDWAQRAVGASKVPWQQTLGAAARAIVTTARGHSAWSYNRPSRRQSPGVIMPARVAAQVDAAVIADISGSVAPHLDQVLAEISHILDTVGVTGGAVTILGVDDEVASTTVLTRRGNLTLAPRAGHRTDLRPGFAAAARANRGRPPSLVIVLTDGLTPWPQDAPPYPVIIGLIGPARRTNKAAASVPTWARVVHIEVEDGD